MGSSEIVIKFGTGTLRRSTRGCGIFEPLSKKRYTKKNQRAKKERDRRQFLLCLTLPYYTDFTDFTDPKGNTNLTGALINLPKFSTFGG